VPCAIYRTSVLSLGILVLLVECLTSSGCGNGRPKLVKVTGKVTLDGKPLEGAAIVFQPKASGEKAAFQRPSTGVTDAQGQFVVRTYEPGDGLPYGEYLVGVQKREVVGQSKVDPGDEASSSVNITYKWVVPKSYADPLGSTLTSNVTSSGMNPSEFALTTGGKPAQIEIVGPRARINDP
jgi:hypothetical protein